MEQTLIKLHHLGFSEYEAKAYVALLKGYPVTGYELSKNSGVPRSMIYQTLQRLIDKGATMTIFGQPVKYMPAKPDDVFNRLRSNYITVIEDVQQELSQLSTPTDLSYFWNIKGYSAIISKIKYIISETQDILYLSACSEEIVHFETELTHLYKRGCKIEILVRGEVHLPIQNIYPYIERSIDEKNSGRWLTILSDSREVLIGEGLQDNDCIALWTKNTSLITVSLRYIKYEMFIAQKFNQIHTWSE
jgi:HTH-type transcriptional regulator, sugar sensing transcriptional regulator